MEFNFFFCGFSVVDQLKLKTARRGVLFMCVRVGDQ